MPSGYAQPGFTTARKKGRSKSFDEQVEIATTRFTHALIKFNGSITVGSERDMVAFGVKHIHNRGRELGDYENGEFRKVITQVVENLLATTCSFDSEQGRMILKAGIPKRRKPHQMHRGRMTARIA